MGDLAIETQGDEVEDPDDFGVERGVPFTRKRAFYRVESAQARDWDALASSTATKQSRRRPPAQDATASAAVSFWTR